MGLGRIAMGGRIRRGRARGSKIQTASGKNGRVALSSSQPLLSFFFPSLFFPLQHPKNQHNTTANRSPTFCPEENNQQQQDKGEAAAAKAPPTADATADAVTAAAAADADDADAFVDAFVDAEELADYADVLRAAADAGSDEEQQRGRGGKGPQVKASSSDDGNVAFTALYLVTAAPAPSALGDRALADAACDAVAALARIVSAAEAAASATSACASAPASAAVSFLDQRARH